MFWPFRREVKLVCFDLDDTLYNFILPQSETEAHIAKFLESEIKKLKSKNKKNKNMLSAFTVLSAFNDVKSRHMHHDIDPSGFSRSLWLKETIGRLDESSSVGINWNTLIQKCDSYEDKYWKYIIPRIKIQKDAVDTLEYLKKKGLKIAAITDSDGGKDIKINRIKKLGIEKYFDYIITSDDTGKNKPSVENWESLIKISSIPPKDCMMIGDHPEIDLINAKKLGFIAVWTKEYVNSDLHERYVDYEIHKIKDVIDIVKKINNY